MHDELNSYCGDGVRMEGKLKFKGALRFEGRFKGEIETADTLIVGPTGKLEAKVEAGSLYNMGEINGNVRGYKRISILSGSRLNGNIDTPALLSEEGALFRGQCSMPENLPAGFFEPKESKLKKTLNTTFQNFWSATGFSMPRTPEQQEQEEADAGKKRRRMIAAGAGAALLAVGLPLGWFVIQSKNSMGSGMLSRYIYERFSDNDPEKLRELADAYYAEESWNRAAAVYERIKELTTPDAGLLKRLAETQEKSGDGEAAAGNYLEYLRENPKDDAVLASLKKRYADKNESAQLMALDELLIEARTDLADVPKELFELYSAAGKREQALELYKGKIAQNPRTFEDLMIIGGLQKQLGRVNESIETFTSAVRTRASGEAWYELAYAYHKAGLEDKALDLFSIYGRIAPESPEALNNQGYASLAQGRTDSAMELFQSALQKEPKNLRSFLGMAIAYSRRGDAEKAEELCVKILELDPNYGPAHNRMAWLYAQQKRNLDEALKHSIASMQYNENVPDYIDTLSEIYYQQQKYDKAIELIEKAIKLRPVNPYFRTQLEKFNAARKQSAPVN